MRALPEPSEIRVTLLQLGKRAQVVALPAGADVAQAFERGGMELRGKDVRLNGRAVELDHQLADNDLITLIPRIKGGQGVELG
jgi:molybdopterin converting factor small subunit